MKAKQKKQNLAEAANQWDILAAYDHTIVQLSPYHFRIDGRLDVWPSTKKAYDTISHVKYEYEDLVELVMTKYYHAKNELRLI